MSKILTGMNKNGDFRVHLALTTDMCQEARSVHKTTPVATAALGRTLTAAAMMSKDLKSETARLSIIIKGNGPAGQIIVTADGAGNVKGNIANPFVDLPLKNGKLDVGGALGIGDLTVVKDIGLKEPYSGTIALASGEIAEDLTAYYYISEQRNTSVALGVKVGKNLDVVCAAGLFVQMLPGASEKSVQALEKLLSDMLPITSVCEIATEKFPLLSEEGLLEAMRDEIFKEVPKEFFPETLEFKDARWKCDCSKERMQNALMTIGRKEIENIIEEDGKAELVCHFCNTKYDFSKQELEDVCDLIKRGANS